MAYKLSKFQQVSYDTDMFWYDVIANSVDSIAVFSRYTNFWQETPNEFLRLRITNLTPRFLAGGFALGPP